MRRHTVWIIVASLGVAAVAGCSEHTSGPPPRPACAADAFAPPYTRVDACSPAAVITAAAVAMFSYAPAEQHDPSTAFRDAAPLLDAGYGEQVGASAVALAPITSGGWDRWATDHVTVTATAVITSDDHPPDTAESVSRVVAVTQHSNTGSAVGSFTAYMRAARLDPQQRWLVDLVEVR